MQRKNKRNHRKRRIRWFFKCVRRSNEIGVNKLTGYILSQIVIKFVQKLGLNIQNMVSVSTYTEAIMTGKNGGAVKF